VNPKIRPARLLSLVFQLSQSLESGTQQWRMIITIPPNCPGLEFKAGCKKAQNISALSIRPQHTPQDEVLVVQAPFHHILRYF
jgi:hypothetical protein